MELIEAMQARHSVRSYTDRRIEGDTADALRRFVEQTNAASGLHMQLVLDEPDAFGGFMAHYGKFTGVRNYLVLAGQKNPQLEEKCGYYGEKFVLYAQTLGLNTCWVALTYNKGKTRYTLADGEKLCVVIALGYGAVQGVAHTSKPREQVMQVQGEAPQWFLQGVDAALLAPTAMNQQKFTFVWDGKKLTARAGSGFYTKIDLGIAEYHFELGAGRGELFFR